MPNPTYIHRLELVKCKAPRDKTESYRLYHAGAFGNRLRCWSSLGDFLVDYQDGKWPEDQPIALRLRQKPGITPPNYCVALDVKTAVETANQWLASNVVSGYKGIEVNEIGPDDLIVLQGEVQRDHNGWQLRYSTHKTIMRHAWPHHEHNLVGLTALHKLRQVMDIDSFDNLMRLFDEYDSPCYELVIEFSTYSMSVGDHKLNTVIWELRAY